MRFSVGFSGVTIDLLNAVPKGSRASVVNALIADSLLSDKYYSALVRELGVDEARAIRKKINYKLKGMKREVFAEKSGYKEVADESKNGSSFSKENEDVKKITISEKSEAELGAKSSPNTVHKEEETIKGFDL